MSRAACSASVVSAACSEPTCLCARPLRLRMKTSHSGVFGVAIMTSLIFIPQLVRRSQPVTVARPVASQHLLEFVPVDRAVLPVSGRRVLLHVGVGNHKPEI